MTNSKKTLAALAILGTLSVGATAQAWNHGGRGPQVPPCAQQVPSCMQSQAPCAQYVPPCAQAHRGYGYHHPYAYGPNCGDMMPQMEAQQAQRPDPVQIFEARKAMIEKSLELNEDQKAAWNDYTKALDASHQRVPQPQAGQRLSGQERLEARAENLKARSETMEALAKARATFVGKLNAEQVATLDRMEGRSHPGYGYGFRRNFNRSMM